MKLKILSLATLLTLSMSCMHQKQEGVQLANPTTFEQKMTGNDVQIVDVRTPEEYESGHIPKAINMNVNDASFDEKVTSLDKEKPVMVYCKMGGRSAKAASKLKEAGFKVIIDLEGGITNWQSENRIVE